jgi:hypothetical protein
MGGKRFAAVLASGNDAANSDKAFLSEALAGCLHQHAAAN